MYAFPALKKGSNPTEIVCDQNKFEFAKFVRDCISKGYLFGCYGLGVKSFVSCLLI